MPYRVLLISANRCAVPDPVFPLGLAHISGALRQAGHNVRWLDLQASTEGLEQVLAEFRPEIAGISIRNIDDVLIRKQAVYYGPLRDLCARIHTLAGCPVVLGGSGFSIFPRELLDYSEADYGLAGAAEDSFVELLNRLENNLPIEAVPGLHRRTVDAPAAVASPSATWTAPEFPRELARYYLASGGMLNLQTQRGCSFHCCYCTYPLIEGRLHERRPAEAVVDDFARIAGLGAKYVFIVDSVFNSSARHVTEICEALVRRGNKIEWGCFLRPQGLTPELMRLMRQAGLRHIEFGTDSFSDKVLGAYHKGLLFEDVLWSSQLAARERIDFCHFLILGGPGETLATIEESFQKSRAILSAVIMAVVGMRIYPGTALFRRAVSEGALAPHANLLSPRYYLAPGLTSDAVFEKLQGFAKLNPNWIAGDPAPGYSRLVDRLRARGVVGPLWSYLSMLQRVWPVAQTTPAEGPTPSATK